MDTYLTIALGYFAACLHSLFPSSMRKPTRVKNQGGSGWFTTIFHVLQAHAHVSHTTQVCGAAQPGTIPIFGLVGYNVDTLDCGLA